MTRILVTLALVAALAMPAAAQTGLAYVTRVAEGDYWEMLLPSQYAKPTPLLGELAAELHLERRETPLALLLELNKSLYDKFDYVPNSTKVDSPIDDALRTRRGVCQDFAHIMIALVRQLKIPCRYVSGYLFHERDVAG